MQQPFQLSGTLFQHIPSLVRLFQLRELPGETGKLGLFSGQLLPVTGQHPRRLCQPPPRLVVAAQRLLELLQTSLVLVHASLQTRHRLPSFQQLSFLFLSCHSLVGELFHFLPPLHLLLPLVNLFFHPGNLFLQGRVTLFPLGQLLSAHLTQSRELSPQIDHPPGRLPLQVSHSPTQIVAPEFPEKLHHHIGTLLVPQHQELLKLPLRDNHHPLEILCRQPDRPDHFFPRTGQPLVALPHVVKVFRRTHVSEPLLVPPALHRRPVQSSVLSRPELEVHEQTVGLQVHHVIFHVIIQTVNRTVNGIDHRLQYRRFSAPHRTEYPEQPGLRQSGKIYRLALPVGVNTFKG